MRSATILLSTRLAVLTVLLVTSVSVAQDQELEKITSELQQLEKLISDPASGEREYRDARGKLNRLSIRIDSLLEDSGDEDGTSSANKVHDRIVKTLKTVRARLTTRPGEIAKAGFPIPQYDESKLLGELAAELQQAQTALANHLHKSPDDEDRTKPLLRAFILAEEQLAWEAGWPFTRSEVADFNAAGKKLTVDLYLARCARGVERINEKLKSEHSESGRSTPRSFRIHAPEGKAEVEAITKALARTRGDAAEAWSKGTQRFDKDERQALLNGRTQTDR